MNLVRSREEARSNLVVLPIVNSFHPVRLQFEHSVEALENKMSQMNSIDIFDNHNDLVVVSLKHYPLFLY